MVSFTPFGATIRLGCLWLILQVGASELTASSQVFGGQSDPNGGVQSALRQGSFPWYDDKTDRVQPVQLKEDSTSSSPRAVKTPGWGWGDYLVFLGFFVALAVLVGLVLRFWKRFEPSADTNLEPAHSPSARFSGEILLAGLRRDGASDDPWAEANRRRLAGDFAGAILCVFAHQLLTLSRLGLVRLAPGRTGRQLHRAVADPEFQTLMTPTLRQFEAVYYGHRTPSASDFAAVWTSAEAFERRAAQGVAG